MLYKQWRVQEFPRGRNENFESNYGFLYQKCACYALIFLGKELFGFQILWGTGEGKVTPGHAPDTDIKIERKYRLKSIQIFVSLNKRSKQNLVISYLTR